MITRTAHILLAALIFISSTGFVVSKHYCRNELKSVALFGKAEPCHPEQAMKSCPLHPQQSKKKGCCDDKTEYFKAGEDQVAPSFGMGLADLAPLLVVLPPAFLPALPAIEAHLPAYRHYKPPIVYDDLQPLLQVFRL